MNLSYLDDESRTGLRRNECSTPYLPLPDHICRVPETWGHGHAVLRMVLGHAMLLWMVLVLVLLMLLLMPFAVSLAVVLPCCRFPWGELDLEAVVDVVDHGAGARHRLHHRVLDLEPLLQVAADGIDAVELVLGGGRPLLGEPPAAEPADDAGGDGEEGDHGEHGEHRAERAPGRGGRLRVHDGVGGWVVTHGLRKWLV
ncbi:hypothetical protein EE612_013194 [Oryza sativa]|jgi:hypothetical protein|nr:hypothetical protein EE612_013194 [Oryza sativa]